MYVFDIYEGLEVLRAEIVGFDQASYQVFNILFEAYIGQVVGLVELVIYQRHGVDASLAFLKHERVLLVLDEARLELQQAGYDLHVVLDAVMDLF